MDRQDRPKDMPESLEMWLTGWRKGDAEMILGSVSDDFVYNDPVDGRFKKAEFAVYLDDMFSRETPFVTAAGETVFEEITEIVMHEQDGELTAWGWWRTASAEGAGLVKVGPEGVRSETTAYHSRPE